jgi:hypothetical protein
MAYATEFSKERKLILFVYVIFLAVAAVFVVVGIIILVSYPLVDNVVENEAIIAFMLGPFSGLGFSTKEVHKKQT